MGSVRRKQTMEALNQTKTKKIGINVDRHTENMQYASFIEIRGQLVFACKWISIINERKSTQRSRIWSTFPNPFAMNSIENLSPQPSKMQMLAI